MVVAVAVIHIMSMGVAPRHIMSLGFMAVTFVAYDVGAPIRMAFFPVMKARQAGCIQSQPDITGT